MDVVVSTAQRVDTLVHRSHALVRHDVAGLDRADIGA